MSIYANLKESGLLLPPPPAPQGHYSPVAIHQQTAMVSGQVSRTADGVITGPVSEATPADQIRLAAETCVLRALSILEQRLGSLENIERIVFMRGFIWGVPGFSQYPQVLDHASRLLTRLFGEAGEHARSAVGVAGLPGNGMLEIELVVSLTTAS